MQYLVDEAISIHTLFDIDELQSLQNSFSELTGLASIITLPNGIPLTQPSHFCDFCKIIRNSEKGLENCIKSDNNLAKMSFHSQKGQIQPCLSSGLWDAGVSISVNNVHLANWLIGQIRSEDITEEQISDYAETIGVVRDELCKAFRKVPSMSDEQFRKSVSFLEQTVSLITEKALANYNLKHEVSKTELLNRQIEDTERLNSKRLNKISQGIVVCKPDGDICFNNASIIRMFSYLNDKLEGNAINSFSFRLLNKQGDEISKEDYPVFKISKTLLPIENEIFGVNINDRDTIWIKLNGMPVLNANNEIFEIIFTIDDITAEKDKNEHFINTIQFFEKSQRIALLGTFTVRLKENKWYGSELLYELLGFEDHVIKTHKDLIDLVHPDHKELLIQTISNAIDKNDTVFRFDFKINKNNQNTVIWLRVNARIIRDIFGVADEIFGTLQDITEIKNAEEKALNSEIKYKQILENVLDVYYRIDMDLTLYDISPSIKQFVGIEPATILGRKFDLLFSNKKNEKEFVRSVLKNKKIHDHCISIAKENGDTINVSISASIIYDSHNHPQYIEGFIRDVTERKQTEAKLKASEVKLRNYFEYSPVAVVVSDEKGKTIEVNPSATRLTEYSAADLIKMDKSLLFNDSNSEKFRNHNIKAQKFGLASDELCLVTKSGNIKNVIVDTVRLPDQQYIGFVTDITYRFNIEKQLRQEQEKLEDAQSLAQIGNASIDFETGRWESSEILDQIIGIDENYNKSILNWISIIHPDSIGELKDYFLNDVLQKKITFKKDFKIIRVNDNDIRWLQVIAKPKFDSNNVIKSLNFTLQDITERKEWTNKLYKSEQLYRTTLNASPDVIVVSDLSGNIKMISPAANNMFRASNLDALIGHSMTEFIDPNETSDFQKNIKKMFNTYPGTAQYKMRRANGEFFPTEVNGDVIRDFDGNPINFVFIIRDITQRKQIEENLTKSQQQIKEYAELLQSVREEEKIALAREIHDDLGQVLVALKFEMGSLKQKLTNDKDIISKEFIASEMSRMVDYTSKTIAIVRRIMSDLRSENIKSFGFIESAKMFIDNFNERNNIQCTFSNTANAQVLNQKQTVALYRILQESLNNILKHAKATKVDIQLKENNNNLILKISDNGCGFDQYAERKTNSFGLLGMKERVALLGGMISIKSEINNGTHIEVEIPLDIVS